MKRILLYVIPMLFLWACDSGSLHDKHDSCTTSDAHTCMEMGSTCEAVTGRLQTAWYEINDIFVIGCRSAAQFCDEGYFYTWSPDDGQCYLLLDACAPAGWEMCRRGECDGTPCELRQCQIDDVTVCSNTNAHCRAIEGIEGNIYEDPDLFEGSGVTSEPVLLGCMNTNGNCGSAWVTAEDPETGQCYSFPSTCVPPELSGNPCETTP